MRSIAKGYVLRNEIGRGVQGIVWAAVAPDGRRVVAKECNVQDGQREFAMLKQIETANRRISNVVRCFDSVEEGMSCFVILEELGHTLGEAVPIGELTPYALKDIAMDTARAVCEVANAGLAHCDLKPENFGVSMQRQRIVLFDMGAAVKVGESSKLFAEFLSAPEVVLGRTSESCDSYAWARLVELLLTGMVDIGPENSLSELVPWVGRQFAGLVQSCTALDPVRRPSAKALAGLVKAALASLTACPSCQAPQFSDGRSYPCCVTNGAA